MLVCLLAACLPHYAKSARSGDSASFANTGEPQSPATGAVTEDAPECVPYTRAREKVGEIACITGKVIEVHTTKTGVTYLNFCRDYRDCSFSVVVLGSDARRLRDVRVLQGREIRITGKVTQYEGRIEMRWQKSEQVLVAVDEDKAARKK
jgi:DNA/RNA endonuclease YhcR with UshA esterase domain